MEPEQVQDITHYNKWNQVTPLSKYLAMALFVILPFVGGWVGYHYGLINSHSVSLNSSALENSNNNNLSNIEVVFEPVVFKTNEYNLSYELPVGWIDSTNETSYGFLSKIKDPVLVLKNPSNGCMIGHGSFTHDFLSNYQSVSFDGFGGNWYSLGKNSRMGLSSEREYQRGEVRSTPRDSVYNGRFFLWQIDGDPVPDECNDSLNKLLQSTEVYFETVSFSDFATGTLMIRHEYFFNSDKTHLESKAYLLVKSASGSTYKIIDLKNTPEWSGYFYLQDKKIYGRVNEDADIVASYIISLNLDTHEIDYIPGTKSEGEYVWSLWVTGDTLYYVKINTYGLCGGGDRCTGDLYSVNVNGDGSVLRKKNVLNGELIGMIDSDTILISSINERSSYCGEISQITLSTEEETTLFNSNESCFTLDNSEQIKKIFAKLLKPTFEIVSNDHGVD